eukprot:CAMPEP_0176357342 /NCGR_PEP_ID=MMETSP0126-20121128/14706_1 /TAXON_ID=141414 ORGANISM="Strombidinopsis acuminatum, Strain SPMC142" /NCGR_SAMPLE_ID=MMETSP0126 /ASSEMBLY_ACC=CAM_ASM_000229 /LENGTH=85 /DNA_ID=CAMNT_0017710911 /DNA_START=492 /DNA_END=749 /DNA_ORIENTATION=-
MELAAKANRKKTSKAVEGASPIYERADAILERKKKKLAEIAEQKELERKAKLKMAGLEDEEEIIEKTNAKSKSKKINVDHFEQKY